MDDRYPLLHALVAMQGRWEEGIELAWATLSVAERRVLELVCKGLTNPQIAESLFVSRRTVQSHLYNMFKKVKVSTRTELAAEAVRRGLATYEDERAQ